MLTKKESAVTRQGTRDPFALLRQMTSDVERAFNESVWPTFRFPALGIKSGTDTANWLPEIDVFEKDNRLVTKVDLPGLKKEDVKVEVTDGHLAISGERKSEAEEKKEHYYKSERKYGSFYRAVPLPEGVKLEDVKATFADGVLEVSIPLPVQAPAKVRKVEIQDTSKAAKTAA
jgi:HSP20 family protein